MKFIKWHLRNSKKRRHPVIVFAESDDGLCYFNLGLTHSQYRGHHKNLSIHDPTNWNEVSFIRDDMSIDEKNF